ncbi:unnamed protein product [Protopolystoma xenopodis]|uniref:Uncharacterized protein n=1 Tax=Protopolystoma xenopodis TaxID=117903 RepID=A0A3S5AZP4_9PLAT|nr:unnamed protein product [Protopolystoma xenopodis]
MGWPANEEAMQSPSGGRQADTFPHLDVAAAPHLANTCPRGKVTVATPIPSQGGYEPSFSGLHLVLLMGRPQAYSLVEGTIVSITFLGQPARLQFGRYPLA